MTERILLIEDDHRLATMVQDYLGEAEFRVEHAANGTIGIARHGREDFDALILDLMLPDMDGLEICRSMDRREGVRKSRRFRPGCPTARKLLPCLSISRASCFWAGGVRLPPEKAL